MFFEQLQKRVMLWSRKQKLDHFYSLRHNGESVLDVGVAKLDRVDSVNIFLKQLRDDPAAYTGLAIDDISSLGAEYPGKTFCQYAGGEFPFIDDAFDWLFSNAVIEHVGERESQLLFLREICRVSKIVFLRHPINIFPSKVIRIHCFAIGDPKGFIDGVGRMSCTGTKKISIS